MPKSNFIGESGEHFVAYKLASKGLCVGLTIGNMPNIDLLVSSDDGLSSIALQVKTSKGAYRKNRYGCEGFEWDVGSKVINKHSVHFWYVFIDFKGDFEREPDAYIVPSLWVAKFVKESFSRKMYFLPIAAKDKVFNQWTLLERVLNEDQEIIAWASKWDEDLLIRWGD